MAGKNVIFILVVLFELFSVVVKGQVSIYHWSSDEGVIIETGGSIVQHNSTVISHINNECSGYYVITLSGRGDCIDLEDDSEYAQYMEISLVEGVTFRAGDKITITGMRNTTNLNDCATIFMQFCNTIPVVDQNTWNNLGMLSESSTTNNPLQGPKRIGEGNEDFSTVSAFPSTFCWIVPQEVDGCTTLRLSRDKHQCLLYLTEIDVTRENTTRVDHHYADENTIDSVPFGMSGNKVNDFYRGIVVYRGKKTIKK